MLRGTFLLLLLCSTGLRSAICQEPPTVRATSPLVLVQASPIDKHGAFVGGLKSEDFTLLVDGKPVKISSIDEVLKAPGPVSLPASSGPDLALNTYTNISRRADASPNLVVVLVDFLNTPLGDRMSLRNQLLKYFAKKLSHQQSIAVYGLSMSLILLHPFTENPAALIQVARTLLDRKDLPRASAGSVLLEQPVATDAGGTAGALEAFLSRASLQFYNLDQYDRAMRTLEQFRQLAGALAGVPGHKSVLWLTGDPSPLNPTFMHNIMLQANLATISVSQRQISKAYEDLNGAAISLFPMDVRGVTVRGGMKADEASTRGQIGGALSSGSMRDTPYSGTVDMRQGEAANAALAMEGAAAETGGMVLAGSNELGELLDRAQRLWQSYYVLSFVPETAAKPDSAYHEIKVKLDRPVSKILARQGFVLSSNNLVASNDEIQSDLSEALKSPLDLTSLGLTLTLDAPQVSEDEVRLPFALTIGPADLEAKQDEKGFRFEFVMAAVVRDPSGKIVSNKGERVSTVFSADQIEEVKENGLTRRGELEYTSEGRCSARLIVRDINSRRMGSITIMLPDSR
jgi:VWFA-related protein